MGTKKVPYSNKGVSELPINKPVLYRILTNSGNINYVVYAAAD